MAVFNIDIRFTTDENPVKMRDLLLEATAGLDVVVGDIVEVAPIETVLERLKEIESDD